MSVTMLNNAIEPFLASDGATNGATVGAGLVPARKKFSNSKIRDDNMDIGRAQDPPLRLRGTIWSSRTCIKQVPTVATGPQKP